jgi:SAM-dependent methyltransferase
MLSFVAPDDGDDRRVRLLEELREAQGRAASFSGWNFDWMRVTPLEAPPAWDYVALVRDVIRPGMRVIDLGTGGGEVYGRIIHGVDAQFLASEAWHVNAPVAHGRLGRRGVAVVHASSERTPWRDAAFDVVLSKHEAIAPGEIVWILRPGGVFITQQVADGQWRELDACFPERARFPDHYRLYREGFEAAGLTVESRYHEWRVAYERVADVAFMLMVAPWEVPGFDAVRDAERLMALEDACRTEAGVVMTLARYLMVARKGLRRAPP